MSTNLSTDYESFRNEYREKRLASLVLFVKTSDEVQELINNFKGK
jgi:hypothetical protein